MTGLGLGPLVAGIFAAYVAMPTRSVFWAYLGVCVLALAAIAVIPETVPSPDRVISIRPRLGVPPGMRAVMIGACLGVFAAFSILGFFSSLVPTFPARNPRRAEPGPDRSGVLPDLHHRRDQPGGLGTTFAAAYLGLGLPAVLTGLISQLVGTVDASAYTSGFVAAIVLVAFAVVRHTYGTAPAPQSPARRWHSRLLRSLLDQSWPPDARHVALRRLCSSQCPRPAGRRIVRRKGRAAGSGTATPAT